MLFATQPECHSGDRGSGVSGSRMNADDHQCKRRHPGFEVVLGFVRAAPIMFAATSMVTDSAQTINNWVNRAAFANGPDNRFDNAPVGNVEAPGLRTYNLSVSKNFQFHERFRLRYQADFFNAFNSANFTGLNTSLASSAFGTLPTAYPPRNIQTQLKLTF